MEALILGLVQGFTEFLPVSSSGHLTLIQKLLGYKDLQGLIFFDVICHLGTLCSIGVIFHKEIVQAFKDKNRLIELFVATLPLFPLVLVIKPIKSIFDRVDLLGYFFLITAFILWWGTKKGYDKPLNKKPYLIDALTIGMFQGLALLPGVSRSGSTISGARLRGWPMQEAITFSFLLGIIAILGSSIVELVTKSNSTPIGVLPLSIGFIVSFLSGIAALLILIRVSKKNLLPFAVYCLILGLVTLYLYG
ncbi:MAG: undecaprenyl-diphosphate phosphatase [Parachlamydiaceae bacterium]